MAHGKRRRGCSSPTASGREQTESEPASWSWTDPTHESFVRAVFQVGLHSASPRQLLETMPTFEGMTTEHLKSHLQKFRLNKRRSREDVERALPLLIARSVEADAATDDNSRGANRLAPGGGVPGFSTPWQRDAPSLLLQYLSLMQESTQALSTWEDALRSAVTAQKEGLQRLCASASSAAEDDGQSAGSSDRRICRHCEHALGAAAAGGEEVLDVSAALPASAAEAGGGIHTDGAADLPADASELDPGTPWRQPVQQIPLWHQASQQPLHLQAPPPPGLPQPRSTGRPPPTLPPYQSQQLVPAPSLAPQPPPPQQLMVPAPTSSAGGAASGVAELGPETQVLVPLGEGGSAGAPAMQRSETLPRPVVLPPGLPAQAARDASGSPDQEAIMDSLLEYLANTT